MLVVLLESKYEPSFSFIESFISNDDFEITEGLFFIKANLFFLNYSLLILFSHLVFKQNDHYIGSLLFDFWNFKVMLPSALFSYQNDLCL